MVMQSVGGLRKSIIIACGNEGKKAKCLKGNEEKLNE